MKLMSSDLVWVPVFYRFGLLGVALVVLLYATMGWRATRLGLSGDGDSEFLALILLGVVVGTFLEGFVSWTFLNPARYPMGFWLFALVAAEACRRRSEFAEAPASSTTVRTEGVHV
jgi:O-antigen ligase